MRSGWALKNIGDIGHTPGTLALLSGRFPKARITLWSDHLNEQVEAMLRHRFPRLEFVRGQLADRGRPCAPALAAAFDSASLFLFNSGMLLNHGVFGHDWNVAVYNTLPFWRCIESGVPFGIYGQSFDGFAQPSLHLFRPVLERAAFLFARDSRSVQYLSEECGIRSPAPAFAPDGCFGIDVRDEPHAASWLSARKLEDDRFLAVVIRTNSALSTSASNLLNPSTPNEQETAENDLWMGVCATVIERWVRETGLPVLVAPESLKEIAAAREMLLPRLAGHARPRVVLREEWWNADEAVSTFARARAVFGMEPHSLIMALTCGVPIVHARPLRHGRKGWMFQDIGLGKWLFDIDADPADAIAETVLSHHHHAGAARAMAGKAMAFVRKAQEATLDAIAETLASSNT